MGGRIDIKNIDVEKGIYVYETAVRVVGNSLYIPFTRFLPLAPGTRVEVTLRVIEDEVED